MCCALFFADNILVNDLKTVVVYVFLVNDCDILRLSLVILERLYVVFLNSGCFFYDALFAIGEFLFEESFPFIITKFVVIEFLKFLAKICNKVCVRFDSKILVALRLKLLNELTFKVSFALVCT